MTSRSEYNAFGESSPLQGGSANRIGYTGQRLDAETGLMPLGNGERYYSPTLARFIQQDSVSGKINNPASLNRYSYAQNNPNKYTDPSGNFVFAIVLIPFLIGVAVSVYQQDQQIKRGERKQEDFSMSEAAVNYTVIGTTYKASTGQDAVSGRQLSGTERAIAIGETALEFASVAGKIVGGTVKAAKYARIANAVSYTAEGTQAAIGVYRGANNTVDLIKQGDFKGATLTAVLTALGTYGGYQSYKGLKFELPNWKVIPPGVGIDGIGFPTVKFVGGGKSGSGLDDVSDEIATSINSNSPKINDRLQHRLDAWKSYKANGGEMEMKRWVQATQRHYGGVGGGYKSGYSKWIRSQENGIHGNSLNTTGPHDIYAIRDAQTDQIYHFGETGRGYLTRGNEWQRTLRDEYGLETYVQRLRTVPGKRAAKVIQTRYIDTYEKIFGHKPGFTDAERNFLQIQKTRH